MSGTGVMLSVAANTRIFVCSEPTDMRKSFDGLCGLVTDSLGQDPLSGALFLFANRRRDRIKLLVWDGDGYALWYKRLEAGTFQIPQAKKQQSSVIISQGELAMLLDGIDLSSVKRRKRYKRAA
jgi:transposase